MTYIYVTLRQGVHPESKRLRTLLRGRCAWRDMVTFRCEAALVLKGRADLLHGTQTPNAWTSDEINWIKRTGSGDIQNRCHPGGLRRSELIAAYCYPKYRAIWSNPAWINIRLCRRRPSTRFLWRLPVALAPASETPRHPIHHLKSYVDGTESGRTTGVLLPPTTR